MEARKASRSERVEGMEEAAMGERACRALWRDSMGAVGAVGRLALLGDWRSLATGLVCGFVIVQERKVMGLRIGCLFAVLGRMSCWSFELCAVSSRYYDVVYGLVCAIPAGCNFYSAHTSNVRHRRCGNWMYIILNIKGAQKKEVM